MTGRPRKPRGPGDRPPPRQPAKPKGFDDVPELSPEEVERRVDVRGGGAPRGPVERPVRVARPPRKQERTLARDSLLLIGLVIVGLVAVRFILPEGPLTAVSSASPGASEAALATLPPVTFGPTRTPFLETLTPVDTPSSEPEITQGPTVKPVPTPTLKPGETPHPTPKPTPKPTPHITPPPGSPTLTVVVTVVHTFGGTAGPEDWTFAFNGSSATPSTFTGKSAGTVVTLTAGTEYQIFDTPNTAEAAGYITNRTSHCGSGTGGTLAAGVNALCTITKYDQPVQIKVVTNVDVGSPADWSVSVDAAGVTPSGSVSGSSSGRFFTFDAHASFDVTQTGPSGYDLSTGGTCTGSGLTSGTHITCTYNYTTPPPPPTDPPPTDPPAPTAWFFSNPWWTTLRVL